ncbi:MAG: C39 family peptidase [Patescibacteria group bacterium]
MNKNEGGFGVIVRKYHLTKFSQWLHIEESNWKERGCGIVSLVMVASYYGKLNNETDGEDLIRTLIGKGIKTGCYKEGVGWYHDGLLHLAHKEFGFRGKRWDFSHQDGKEPFEKFLSLLKKGPVIVSVKNCSSSNTHLIVVNGYIKEGGKIKEFLITDPDSIAPATKQMLLKELLGRWTKRFIFIYPPY